MQFQSQLWFGRSMEKTALMRQLRPILQLSRVNTWFGQLKNLSDGAISSWNGHILKPCTQHFKPIHEYSNPQF